MKVSFPLDCGTFAAWYLIPTLRVTRGFCSLMWLRWDFVQVRWG